MIKTLQKFFLFTFLYLLGANTILAGTEPYENFIKGAIKKGDSIILKDEKFRSKDFVWTDITNLSVDNALKLQILDDKPLTRSFSVSMRLRVEYFTTPDQNVAQVIDTVLLDVNYSKGKNSIDKLADIYRFKGAHLVKVYVEDVKSPEYGSAVPPVLQLTSYISVDRKYRFNPELPLRLKLRIIKGKKGSQTQESTGTMETQSISRVSIASVNQTSTENQIELTWPVQPGAEEYDIEWTTADNGSAAGATAAAMVANAAVPEANIKALFRNNATRITTSRQDYLLSLVFNNDYLVVRMRAVHYDATTGLRIEGAWDYRQEESPFGYSAWPISQWHQESLNWQYSSAFAEEGKKKEVITYFDGSLRARQSVTLSNSDLSAPQNNVAVVQENVYDEFGRPAASILPAPVKDPTSSIQYLHYFPKFNLSGTSPYRFNHITDIGCDIQPSPLSTSSGASKYYSSANSFIGDKLFNKYIPDAEGYPISLTQYTADNTGRIKQQGGVGKTFQPGLAEGGKVTKYYYGKPEQWELDRIFGNDVGDATHYLKNMVVDPNGQISVSYLNASGKTIATALAGTKPASMDALNTPATISEEDIKLLQPKQFKFDGSSLKLSATTTYLASVTGEVTLNYDIERIVRNYPGEAFNTCSNCYYDMSITIRDDCNKPVYSTTSPVKIGPESATCPLNAALPPIVTQFDKVGEYYITFDFVMSKNVIETFTREFLISGKQNGAVKRESEFILKYLNKANFEGCFADCRTAVKNLGSQQAFTAMFNQELTDLGVEEVGDYSSYISGLYSSLLSTANNLQSNCNLSPCDIYKQPMLTDVSPGGQYALFEGTTIQEPSTNVIASWFKNGVFDNLPASDPLYQNSLITLENGDEISPYDANFTLGDLITYWKSEWAELFLPKHPEYCKLEFCEQNNGSYNWDEKLRQIYTKAADIAQIAPGAEYSHSNGAWLLAHDPFFQSNPDLAANMQADLDNYSTNILKFNQLSGASSSELPNKNLSQFVDYQIYCADNGWTTNQSAGSQNRWINCTPVADCRVPDREWELYVSTYLELKEKYYAEKRASTTCSTSCQVGQPYVIPVGTGGGGSNCPFGSSGSLMLGADGYQTSINTFTQTYVYGSTNQRLNYTILEGTSGNPPNESSYCSGGTASKAFYGCYKVTLPDGRVRQFSNVWVVTCTINLNSNCYSGYMSTTVNYGNNSYGGPNGSRYFIKYGSPNVQPATSCPSHYIRWDYFCNYQVTDYSSNPNGTIINYTNVWVQLCAQGTYTTTSYMTTMAMESNTTSTSKEEQKKKYASIEKDLQKDESIEIDYIQRKIYIVKNISSPEKNKPKDVHKQRDGFSPFEYKEFFHVRDNNKSYRVMRNVWVAEFIPEPGSKVDQNNKARKQTELQGQTFTSSFNSTNCASDYGGYVSSEGSGVTYLEILLNDNIATCDITSDCELYLYNSSSSSWQYYGTYYIQGGTRTTTAVINEGDFPAPVLWSLCGTSACSGNPPPPPTGSCPPALLTKQSHFGEIQVTDVSGIDVQAYGAAQADSLNKYVSESCNATAKKAIERLAEGLAGYPQATIDLLEAKLAELCANAGDANHPMGASSLPPGEVVQVNGQNCSNFGDVIKNVLSLSNFTPTLNPWLIESPYPYNVKQQAVPQTISTSSAELCARLSTLKQQYQAAPGSAASFHAWLKNQYGSVMSLTSGELDILEKSCGQCKYFLSADIVLPLFLDPELPAEAKICITSQEYQDAIAAMNGSTLFNNTLASTHDNYETIVANYLNAKWGFSFSYDRYKTLGETPGGVLCKESPYTSQEADPYDCVRSLIEQAAGSGMQQFKAYIDEEKRKYWNAYVNACSKAKAYVNLKAKQEVYHYTLYYYDQADNLVRTVPPEGVSFLNSDQIFRAQKAREFSPDECSYTGPEIDARLDANEKSLAFQSLSNTLGSNTAGAVELWMYPDANGKRQVLVSTDSYMVNACVSGNMVNVDIYRLVHNASQEVTLNLSNHVRANISSLLPLADWTHVVVQGPNLMSGALTIWVNGKPFTPVSGQPTDGCGWEINSGSNPIAMPENLDALKHLRLYTGRTLSASEIEWNAGSGCFAALNENNLAWFRFNVPPQGGPTTIAANSTQEVQFKPIYPDHGQPTSYVYNSTNQVIKQKTPDGGMSKFWYDMLSRLVASQNAKQDVANNQSYSYTRYDALGRVTEVGQKLYPNWGLSQPHYLSDNAYQSFLAGGTNSQLTQTQYDQVASGSGVPAEMSQENLRKRVSASIYRETPGSADVNATYYSYDIAGNVKRLYQQVNGLYNQANGTGLKTIDYEYDLVSGKVNFVAYQHNANDQFYYQYDYDAENRLTKAWSSTTATVDPFGLNSHLNELDRKLDASYQYYLHGPLARVELGDVSGKVQGMDYAYTLQGWLKGMNGQYLNPQKDIFKDGDTGSPIARDVAAYSLGYYTNDYAPIGGATSNAFERKYQVQTGDITGQNLYNGNISNSTVAIERININSVAGYTYKYDQLNRLKEFRQHGNISTWNNSSIGTKYNESFSYDGNGNILNASRTGNSSAMDNLSYGYNRDAAGKLINNRLRHVKDAVTAGAYAEDIDNQNDDNYSYDAIGNLIADSQEGITNIDWTVYGKIKSITKASGTITYQYDPSGNRVSKTVNGITTWYLRDAQGNSLTIYDNQNNVANWKEQHLYGSSRLGMWKPEINVSSTNGTSVWSLSGKKAYELTNHLGNVLAVISDTRTLNGSTYEPQVLSAQDYYAGGMIQPGRSFSSDSYRYGFNGKENDNEVKGTGNSIDFGARIYDPRISRWLSVDPKRHLSEGETPYRFGHNNPLRYKDPDGEWEEDGHFWTVYAMGISMGMKPARARELAVKAENYDHFVHRDNSMSIHPHKSGIAWGKDGGFGTWADSEKQKSWHVLTGGLQSHALAGAMANVLVGGDLRQLHTVGDAWAHSYVDESGERRMWGGGHFVFGVSLEHAFFGGHGNEHADHIAFRRTEYMGYVKTLSAIFSNPKFTYNKYVSKKADLSIFSYVQQYGGSKDANIFLLKSFIEMKSGGKNFTSENRAFIDKFRGYLDQQGIKYTTSESSREVSTGASPTTLIPTSTRVKSYNLQISN